MKKKGIIITSAVSLAIVVTVSILFGGGKATAEIENQGAAPQYKVLTVDTRSTDTQKEYVAKIQSKEVVEIRSKVDGYIDAIFVNEGADVRKGEALFKINDDIYIQQVNTANANIQAAKANVFAAKLDIKKIIPLVEKGIISNFELESAQSKLQAVEAQLAQANAQLQNAQINLAYTTITSPVDGVVGQIPYKVGSLVGRSEAKSLTTVSGSGDMYAYFSLNEKELLKMTRDLPGVGLQDKLNNLPEVKLRLADQSIYEFNGKLMAASGIVDAGTGSILLKASFPNAKQLLRTGGSGTVMIPEYFENVVCIPQAATYEMQEKIMVKMVNPAGQVNSRQIEIAGRNSDNQYIVTSGLKAREQIVLEGASKLKEDQKITPVITSLN